MMPARVAALEGDETLGLIICALTIIVIWSFFLNGLMYLNVM